MLGARGKMFIMQECDKDGPSEVINYTYFIVIILWIISI